MPNKSLGDRLKEERERMGYNQTDFAGLVGASKRSQIGWEQGRSSPDASCLAIWAGAGMDALYVLIGTRKDESKEPEMAPEVDVQKLRRIAEMLDAAARQAGRRWPIGQLAAKTGEVYNVLIQERKLDDTQVGRILQLVVNR